MTKEIRRWNSIYYTYRPWIILAGVALQIGIVIVMVLILMFAIAIQRSTHRNELAVERRKLELKANGKRTERQALSSEISQIDNWNRNGRISSLTRSAELKRLDDRTNELRKNVDDTRRRVQFYETEIAEFDKAKRGTR